ncbi:hypothetical protein GCM10010331_53360 [Streptomyces xanthochromogenes]|nr:hypothetical protein GCM10010331_53360 [Streptomyces xanthochromogenes]
MPQHRAFQGREELREKRPRCEAEDGGWGRGELRDQPRTVRGRKPVGGDHARSVAHAGWGWRRAVGGPRGRGLKAVPGASFGLVANNPVAGASWAVRPWSLENLVRRGPRPALAPRPTP